MRRAGALERRGQREPVQVLAGVVGGTAAALAWALELVELELVLGVLGAGPLAWLQGRARQQHSKKGAQCVPLQPHVLCMLTAAVAQFRRSETSCQRPHVIP